MRFAHMLYTKQMCFIAFSGQCPGTSGREHLYKRHIKITSVPINYTLGAVQIVGTLPYGSRSPLAIREDEPPPRGGAKPPHDPPHRISFRTVPVR